MRSPGTQAPGRPALRRLLLPLLLLLLLLAASGRAVPCVSGDLPKPTNITFLSINMKNVLHWNPPEGLHGAEVTYTVQYFIYGQKEWLSVSECRNINRTYCDLSAETSDYEDQYYAKVQAIRETKCSEWVETGRFYPFLETQVGPPEVVLKRGKKSISIVLTAPKKWKINPNDDPVSMQQIYSNLKYNVSVYNNESRMWSQYITNSTMEFSWLEPSTLYCVHVESFVPGPPRLPLPSQKQCVSTLEDQMSALKFKVIFWYVLPTSVVIFLLSVIGYSVYRYIHIGKEKHPSNLVLIYGNEMERFFEPTETITFSFITLDMLDDSKHSQKDMSLLRKSSDSSSLSDPELRPSQEPHLEEVKRQRLGYSLHLMDNVCGAEPSGRNACLSQLEWLSGTMPTPEADTEPEYSVPTDFYREAEDHHLQEEASSTGKLSETQAALANIGPPLEDLCHLGQEHPGSEEGPEKESSTALVDWDSHTRRLCIPSLPSFAQESVEYRRYERDRLAEGGLLSRLYENQAPDKPEDKLENYFVQFMEEWGLNVQMDS